MRNTETSRKGYGQQVRKELSTIKDTSEGIADVWASRFSQFVTEMYQAGAEADYTAKRIYFKATGWKA